MWIDLFIWAEDIKVFLSHVNSHYKVTSAKEDFNTDISFLTTEF